MKKTLAEPIENSRERPSRDSHGDSVRGTAHNRRYIAWSNMLQRCENPRNSRYPSYGGRGITVCPAWHSYPAFAEDMGAPPDNDYAEHSLERLDPDGHYVPGNCVWAPRKVQAQNKRSTLRVVTDSGELKSLPALLDESGSPVLGTTARARHRRGKSANEVLDPQLGFEIYGAMRRRDEALAAEIAGGRLYALPDGRILDLLERRELTPSGVEGDYLLVSIPRLGKAAGTSDRFLASRIVALQRVWNPDPSRYLVAHHENGDRQDNRSPNLAWATHLGNSRARDGKHAGPEVAPRVEVNLSPHSDDEALAILNGERRIQESFRSKSRARIASVPFDPSSLQMLPGYPGSWVEEFPEAAKLLLSAPSNGLQITDQDATIRTFTRDGLYLFPKSIFALASTDRVFFACFDCGYESAIPLEVRTRVGRGTKAILPATRGLDVCACTSLAVQFPELDKLRRADPDTGEYVEGTYIPSRTAGARAYVHCALCGRERVHPIDVKSFVVARRLPVCESCRARQRVLNLRSER